MSEPGYDEHATRRDAPVGVFDSGVGGLTIASALFDELPDERYIYFGDTANCPYGVRPEHEIRALACDAAQFLLDRGAKLIVVACNTASVTALAELRERFAVPFIGVVPAVKPAAERTRVGRIGVAATEASARGDYLKRLIVEHAAGVETYAVGCPDLVTLVEAGALEGPVVEAATRAAVGPLLEAQIDQLVLGCTHFPALRPVFERIVGPTVGVIDSGVGVARQTRRVLTSAGLLRLSTDAGASPACDYWCSGAADAFERVAGAILGQTIQARSSAVGTGATSGVAGAHGRLEPAARS